MFKFLAVTTLLAAVAQGDTVSGPIEKEYTKFSSQSAKIINGREADIEYFPYQVSIGFQAYNYRLGSYVYQHHCGGSIISQKFVLTAAHCLVRNESRTDNSNIIKAGVTNNLESFTDDLSTISIHHFQTVIIHSDYNHNEFGLVTPNDIGLIRVMEPFEYDRTRQPIKLYERDQSTLVKLHATASGWGAVKAGKIYPEILNFVEIPIISQEHCAILRRENNYNGQFCATNPSFVKSTCDGDSGGPLTAEIGSVRYLIGIVSGGPGECTSYSIFTEVAYFVGWIAHTVATYS